MHSYLLLGNEIENTRSAWNSKVLASGKHFSNMGFKGILKYRVECLKKKTLNDVFVDVTTQEKVTTDKKGWENLVKCIYLFIIQFVCQIFFVK